MHLEAASGGRRRMMQNARTATVLRHMRQDNSHSSTVLPGVPLLLTLASVVSGGTAGRSAGSPTETSKLLQGAVVGLRPLPALLTHTLHWTAGAPAAPRGPTAAVDGCPPRPSPDPAVYCWY